MRAEMIEGAYDLRMKYSEDVRGSFCELDQVFMPSMPRRFCVAHNPRETTLRGLHHQQPAQHKVVVCTAGQAFDVVVDLRPESPTYLQWTSFHLRPGDGVNVPLGCAHGYMTLKPNTSMGYILEGDRPDDLGVRWDDSKIAIAWPAEPAVISERDRVWRLS